MLQTAVRQPDSPATLCVHMEEKYTGYDLTSGGPPEKQKNCATVIEKKSKS